MNIKINAVKFTADKKLEKFIESKVKKLVQFYDNIIGVEVFLKLVNTQKLENKLVEIRIEIPGNDMFAKKQGKTFEEGTDNAIDALKKQITKHKEKLRGV
ncbi:MAG: ribosome-associated translation inhibitor RaiA [Bacteroidales bacterium]|nr:ribosome-associated translation inhibitor RaiA [Bacteroidales bacterium]